MSSQRAALVAAIRAAPDDDDLRLVAADYFEEQGDDANVARAELIRVQVRRSQLPLSDPAHSELQSRELRLLRRWASVWCGSHFAFKKVVFRRGFVERVHLHLQHFQHHRRQLFALEPIREVSLTGWQKARPRVVRRVAACEEWRFVETLHLHRPAEFVLMLLESPHLSRLRALRCPVLPGDDHSRRRFERLPLIERVRELTLPSLWAWQRRDREWFADSTSMNSPNWAAISTLALPAPPISRAAALRLTEMSFWPRLERLSCALSDLDSAEISPLLTRVPAGLRGLSLFGPATSETLPGSVVDRLALAPLDSLELEGVLIEPHDLARLLDRTRCQKIRLNETNLENHVRVLTEARATPEIHTLDLARNYRLPHPAVVNLFSSDRFPMVTRLDLTGTSIGPEGARALATAKGWGQLRVLSLTEVHIGQAELLRLLASPNLQHLTTLSFGYLPYAGEAGIRLTRPLARALARMPHLARVDMRVVRVDPAASAILADHPALAWIAVNYDSESFRHYRRRTLAPEMTPPVDPE